MFKVQHKAQREAAHQFVEWFLPGKTWNTACSHSSEPDLSFVKFVGTRAALRGLRSLCRMKRMSLKWTHLWDRLNWWCCSSAWNCKVFVQCCTAVMGRRCLTANAVPSLPFSLIFLVLLIFLFLYFPLPPSSTLNTLNLINWMRHHHQRKLRWDMWGPPRASSVIVVVLMQSVCFSTVKPTWSKFDTLSVVSAECVETKACIKQKGSDCLLAV